MNSSLETKEIRQGNRFEYLGGTVTGDGKSEAEVLRRIKVGCECMEKGGWSNGRQKDIKEFEREGFYVCNTGLPLRSGDGGTDRDTTTEAAGLREQVGKEDCTSEEGG